MKKILFLSLSFAFFFIPKLHAAGLYDVGEYRVMRTTYPSGAFNLFLTATGTILLDSVQVSSGSATYSSFTFNDSTSAAIITSTSIPYNTTTTGTKHFIRKALKNGFMFSTTGTSVLDIKWDWMIAPPKGQELKGQ